MDPTQIKEFSLLLEKLLSTDNDVRKAAEESYENLPLTQRCVALLQVSKVLEIDVQSRIMSLVLLRRLLSNNWEELWQEWNDETKVGFKSELLNSVVVEPDPTTRKRYADVISEVARNSLDDDLNQQWPEVLKFMFESASSPNDGLKELALYILESVPGVFGSQQEHYLAVIKDMLVQCLAYQPSSQVRATAAKAASSFLTDNEGDTATLKAMNEILAPFILVCAEFCETDTNDDTVIQCLVELAGSVPKFLRPRLSDIFTFCLKTVADKNKDDSIRHSAIEILVTWSETTPPMIRKDGAKFIPEMVEQCLALMVDLDDDDEWALSDDLDDDDGDSNSAVGETSLDRLACALGGKAILQPTLALVGNMLTNTAWQYRHAGLMALSAIGEGCHKQMEPMLQNVVETILPFFKDPHPRVRYASCNAIGQMASDFSPTLQKRLHDKVIPTILATLEDVGSPRTQAHAGAALVNFSEDCPKTILSPYLNDIMAKLIWVLESTFQAPLVQGKKGVLEQIITSIASVADTAEERFIDYYDRIMPCLKYILQNATQDDMKLLRGKTIECISLIGLAVGKEKFLPDANEIMGMLLKAQQDMGEDAVCDADDPQTSYMISAWARICKLLGKEFEQFLPLVMPAVLKTASIKPEVAIVETDEAKEIDDGDDWQFVNLGDQQSFGIKTAGLEEKSTACQMIVCYARELKEAFADWVEPVAKLMVPMLKFYFHDGVRMAAAECLPYLLESAKVKGDDFLRQMWAYIGPELLKAIEIDPDSDALSEHMYSLAKCIECLGFGCITDEQMVDLQKVLDKYLTEHFVKQEERIEKRKDEDYDEEVETDLIDKDEEDVMVLSKISDILHALFQTHKEAFLPVFDQLAHHFVKLLQDDQPYRNRQWGICCFDDVIEFSGASGIKYQEIFLSPMLKALKDPEPELRQAAAYGFGVMGANGNNLYAQACSEALPLLGQMIEAQDARSGEASSVATENAISAVAKILKNNSMIDSSAFIPHWISWLPTWEDREESPHIYGYLCDLIEANHPLVVGDNLPRSVVLILESFQRGAYEDNAEIKNRLVLLLRQIKENGDAFQSCASFLSPEHVATYQSLVP